MKYIKLFENFDSSSIGSTDDLIFDWMPFDNQMSNPLQSSMPESLSTKELMDFVAESEENGNSSQISEAGLFMSHRKNSNGGFTRFITKSISPLTLDIEIFNENFESVNKFPNVEGSKITNLGSFNKATSMLGKFGVFGRKKG
jgi:hypothetical protein